MIFARTEKESNTARSTLAERLRTPELIVIIVERRLDPRELGLRVGTLELLLNVSMIAFMIYFLFVIVVSCDKINIVNRRWNGIMEFGIRMTC